MANAVANTARWFRNGNIDKLKSCALGIVAGLVTCVVLQIIFYTLKSELSWFSQEFSQDAISIFNLCKNEHFLLNCAWKVLMGSYIVIFGPVIEELVFRGWINEKIENAQNPNAQTTAKKVARVVLVALIFGAFHISPFQNSFTNITIFAATAFLGLIQGVLREKRRDLTASISHHMTHNLSTMILMSV